MHYQLSKLGTVAAIVALSLLVFCPGCQKSPPKVGSPVEQPTESALVAGTQPAPTIRIATFNIANLSLHKLAKPAVAATLVRIVRQYDVIAVQELDDASLRAPQAFLDAINQVGGDRYGVMFSGESGLDATPAEKEQYAIYYNSRVIEAVGQGKLYPDQVTKLFVREPFAGLLKIKATGHSIVILTIHTDPDLAPAEIAALKQASDWAADAFEGEDGVVILGDFNAGKRYVKLERIREIREQVLPYLWVVSDDADTTLGAEPQAHDRILVRGDFGRQYTQHWGVDRGFSDKKISDHYPVWAEFRAAAGR